MNIVKISSKALVLLGATALFANAQEAATYDLHYVISGYTNRDQFINEMWKSRNDDAYEPDATKEKAFQTACAQGEITKIEPNLEASDPKSLGITDADWAEFTGADPSEKVYKRVMKKIMSKNKFERKIFWASTPEQSAKTECNRQNVSVYMLMQSAPKERNWTRIIKNEKETLTATEVSQCLTPLAAAAGTPITGTVCNEIDKAQVKACEFCSINNGLLASVLGALGTATIVSLALFF